MDRRILSAGLVAVAVVAALGVVGWQRSQRAGATTSVPIPSPSVSTVCMAAVWTDRSGSHSETTRGTFLGDAAGNVRVHETFGAGGRSSVTWVFAISSKTVTRKTVRRNGRVVYERLTRMSPDYGMRASVISPFEYSYSAAAIVRAALDESDPAIVVTETTYLGRPAWRGSFTKGGWRHTATVDRATGFPLRYVLADTGTPQTGKCVWRVTRMKTNVPVDAATFRLKIPVGTHVDATRQYEHFATTDKLAGKTGYEPFLPASLPEGSVLASASSQPNPWGPYGWVFPFSHPWVDLAKQPDTETHLYYHRGFDWFTVMESPLIGIGNSVPAELDRRPPFSYQKTMLVSGTFAGRTARTWMADGVTLYVQDGDYAVEISGDLTRSEIVAVASSLRR